MQRKLKTKRAITKKTIGPPVLAVHAFVFYLLRADAMKRIMTGMVKESKGRGRHPRGSMALLSLSRFRINWIMLSASTGLQILILWFKLDQSISKFWRKGGQLERK